MPGIEDINFGIKTWYLQPTFFVKILSALFSAILQIIIFVIAARAADKLWKNAVGKGEILCMGLLTIFLVASVLLFLFYFYKIFPDFTIYMFFASIASVCLFTLLFFISCGVFGTQSKLKSATNELNTYINGHLTEKCVINFIKDKNIHSDDFLSVLEEYTKSRTTSAMSLLMPFSFIWILLMAVLYFVVLYESSTTDDSNSIVAPLRPNVNI